MKGKKANMANKPNDPTGKFDANPTPKDVYAGEDSNVLAEAKKRKKGGKVMGEKSMSRCDRAPRKSGGKVGAENSPLTAANKTSNRPGGDIQSKGGMD
jgi:hypothetical protein